MPAAMMMNTDDDDDRVAGGEGGVMGKYYASKIGELREVRRLSVVRAAAANARKQADANKQISIIVVACHHFRPPSQLELYYCPSFFAKDRPRAASRPAAAEGSA